MNEKHKKTIIFDMDGTLYEFKGGSFNDSGIYDAVLENTLLFICKHMEKTKEEARKIIDLIFERYGNSISIGLEKEFGIDRMEYFNFAWDIDPEKYVEKNTEIRSILLGLQSSFNLLLLSDAPRVWVEKVLAFLDIKEIFIDNIFSGEGDTRKELGNAFEEIVRKNNLRVADCIVVGDQEDTDIIPAKRTGMVTVYIGKNISKISDYSVSNILEIKNINL